MLPLLTYPPPSEVLMAGRGSRKDTDRTLELARELSLTIPKNSELVKELARRKGFSLQQARSYVRQVRKNRDMPITEIELIAKQASYEIDYFLSNATDYIDDEITLKRMLRSKFGVSKEEANTLVFEFKDSTGPLGEKAAVRNRDRRSQAWRKLTKKLNNKEWPHVSVFLCTDCDRRAGHYHHPNYAYPLWVEPLCQECHTRVHTIFAQRLL